MQEFYVYVETLLKWTNCVQASC